MRVWSTVGVTVFAVVAVACFDYEERVGANGEKPVIRPDTATNNDTVTGPLTTWHEHVRPLVERHCASCHTTGNSGAIPLDTYAATQGFRQRMVARVNHPLGQGDELPMPPWPFDPTCREVHDARLLSPVEKDVFTAWGATGYTEGDPSRYVPPTPPPLDDLGAPAVSLTRDEGYTPSRTTDGDHRCFLYPQAFARDVWVTRVEINPDQGAVVQQVTLFAVPESEVPAIVSLDEAASGSGYPCFGGSGARDELPLASWVPGMPRLDFPPNSALQVRAGSRLVARIHYHAAHLGEAAVPSDRTGATLWALGSGQIPLDEVRVRAISDLDLVIAPGDANAVASTSQRTSFSETVVGLIPHMHTLGSSLTLEAERAGNPARECLARIPLWDFRWRQSYLFSEPAHVRLGLGDRIHLQCTYDNSAANQPVVDGQRREPREVVVGQGRFDEMCLAYVITTTPVFGKRPPLTPCDGFASCVRNVCNQETCLEKLCSDENAPCILDCMSWSGPECVECALTPLYFECAPDNCDALRANLSACRLTNCADKNFFDCVVDSCRSQLEALHGCLEPHIESGACVEAAPTCGLGPSPGR